MRFSRPAPEIRQVRPGVYSVLAGGRSHEVVLDLDDSGPSAAVATGTAVVDGTYVPIEVADPRRRAAASAGAVRSESGAGAEVAIVAPMPGRVVTIPVAAGDAVERGQTVLILEAMKMESAIGAPRAGVVTEILAAPGQAVQQRQTLLRLRGS